MVALRPRNLSDEHRKLLYACAWKLLRSVKFGEMAKNVEPDDLVNQAWVRQVRYGHEYLNLKFITAEMIRYILSDFTGRSLSAYQHSHKGKPIPKGRMVTPNSALAYIISNNRAIYCEIKSNNLVEDLVCEMVAALPDDCKDIFEQVYGYSKDMLLVSRERGMSKHAVHRRIRKSKKIIGRELGFVIR